MGRDLSQGLPGEYTLIRCGRCGLIYLNLSPREIGSLYTESYDQFTPALSDVPLIDRLARRYGLRKRVNAILRYKHTGRLLDVGCATGDFLSEMRLVPGWTVYGVELNAGAAKYARERVGLDVFHGSLSDVTASIGGYDVITLWNVLEHLPDPIQSLRQIRGLLNDNGLLVIQTPNQDSLDARLFGRHWIGYEIPRHLCVFSQHLLCSSLQALGFRTWTTPCLYGSHAAAASSVRLYLRSRRGPEHWGGILEQLLFALPVRSVFAPIFFALDRLKLSSDITVFCSKV